MSIRASRTAVVFASVLLAGGALAAPPGPGQHFDCSDGGTTSCATDDEGCVPADKLALKCSSTAGKTVAKAVKGATSCHAKQAQMRFQGASITGAGNSEENCEDNPGKSVKSNFDAGVARLTSLGCDPGLASGVAGIGTTLFGSGPGSFDGDNGLVYCDSSSGALIGDDDTGSVAATAAMLKCEISVAKALAKLQATASKCHTKMASAFLRGLDFNEEDCEEISLAGKGGLAKFNSVRDKLVAAGICPPCLDASAMDALAASTIAKEDGNGDVIFPCP
jgi:hypothetical protein